MHTTRTGWPQILGQGTCGIKPFPGVWNPKKFWTVSPNKWPHQVTQGIQTTPFFRPSRGRGGGGHLPLSGEKNEDLWKPNRICQPKGASIYLLPTFQRVQKTLHEFDSCLMKLKKKSGNQCRSRMVEPGAVPKNRSSPDQRTTRCRVPNSSTDG